jgi:hypothetical protein
VCDTFISKQSAEQILFLNKEMENFTSGAAHDKSNTNASGLFNLNQDVVDISPSNNILQTQKIQNEYKVDRYFILTFNLNTLNYDKDRKDWKIIRFVNYDEFHEIQKVLEEQNFDEFHHTFIFVIELNHRNVESDEIEILEFLSYLISKFKDTRPLIVEIKRMNDVKHFIKSKGAKVFQQCKLSLKNENIPSYSKMVNFNLEIMCNILKNVKSSLIDINLMSVIDIVQNEKLKNVKDILRSAIDSNNSILLRFLMIFNTELSVNDKTELFECALKRKKFHEFIALADLPFICGELNDFETMLNINNPYNILKIGVKCHKVDVLKFICLKIPSYCENLMRLAYDNENYEIFCGAKTLSTHSIVCLDIEQKFNDTFGLHDDIQKENREGIKAFISKYPNKKLCLNENKISALEHAIQKRKLKIYSLLLANGFYTHKKHHLEALIDDLSEDEKYEIRNENLKLSIADNESFVNLLIAKCHLSSTSGLMKFDAIKCMIQCLSQIAEIRPLFKVLSQIDLKKIVCDYSNKNVNKIDPTSDQGTMGITYFAEGLIIIGRDLDINSMYGTFSHESCHQVMFAIYNNGCLPYCKGDVERETEWKSIVEKYKIIFYEDSKLHDNIVNWVFQNYFSGYHQEAELIVRVPHMLAYYRDNHIKFNELEAKYGDLFKYYREKIVPDLEFRDGVALRKLNNQLGLLDKLKVLNYEFNNRREVFEKINFLNATGKKRILIVTNSVLLAFCALYKKIYADTHNKLIVDTENIFFCHDTMMKNLTLKQIFVDLKESPSIARVIIDCSTSFVEVLDKEISSNDFNTFVVVTNKIDDSYCMNFDEQVLLNFDWSDLSENTKRVILKKYVNFQSRKIRLNKLISNSTTFITSKVIPFLFEENEIHLRSSSSSEMFYIERKFLRKSMVLYYDGKNEENVFGQSQLRKNVESGKNDKLQPKIKFDYNQIDLNEFFNSTYTEKIILISDYAGTGKSYTLKHIRDEMCVRYKNHWIELIELKQYLDDFKINDFNDFLSFIRDDILKIKNPLESAIFHELYANEKVTLLFDGFDEISPDCKQKVLKLIQLFNENPSHQLWVTTRTHLEIDLEEKFDILAYSIQPLSEQEQIDFLITYWQKDTNINSNFIEIEKFAKKLIKELAFMMANTSSNLIGLPLQVQMLADVYKQSIVNNSFSNMEFNLNFFEIYDKFLKSKIQIWSEGKGNLARKASLNSQNYSLNFLQIHHYFALKHYNTNIVQDDEDDDNDIFFGIEHDEDEWTFEEISRCGIIRFDEKKNFNFLHETFAEFLLADFLSKNLKKKISKRNRIDLMNFFMSTLTQKKFQIVRMFLNDIVSRDDDKMKNISFANQSIPNEILLMCASEGQFDLCLFISKCVGEHLKNIVATMDDEHRNFLMLASLKVVNEAKDLKFEAIFDIIANELSECFKDVLCMVDAHKNTLLHYLSSSSISKSLFIKIWNKISSHLTDVEARKNYLLMHNSDRQTFFHIAMVKYVRNCEKLKTMLNILKQNLTIDEQKHFIWTKDFEGESLIHYCGYQHYDVFNLVIHYIESIFTDQNDLLQLIIHRSLKNDNVFHIMAQLSTKPIIECMLNKIVYLFNRQSQNEDTSKVLKMENKRMKVATNNLNVMDAEKLKDFLSTMGQYDRNALQNSTFNKHHNSFEYIFHVYENNFKNDLKYLIKMKTSENVNLIDLTFMFGSVSKIKFLWNKLNDIFYSTDSSALTEILLTKGDFDRNILCSSVRANESKESFECIWNIYEKVFGEQKMREIIHEKDASENNIFHLSARFGTKENVEFLWSKIVELLPTFEEQKSYLSLCGFNNETALQKSNRHESQDIYFYFQKLYSHYFDDQNLLDGTVTKNQLILFHGSVGGKKFIITKPSRFSTIREHFENFSK